jgi:uncharacterized protein involved in exopolysaccharide biosynthesis
VADLQAKIAAEGPPEPVTPASTGNTVRQRRIRDAQAELKKLDAQISTREAELQRLRGVVTGYQARIDAAPKRETEMVELMRDYSTLQAVYTSLLQRREDAKMSVTLERRQIGEQFKLLDPAKPAERPVSPNRVRMVLLALLAGLALGAGTGALLEYRNATMQTEEEVMRTLGLPVLATIPMMQSVEEVDSLRRRTVLLNAGATALLLACGVVVAVLLVYPAQA